jgi:dynein heavy chain
MYPNPTEKKKNPDTLQLDYNWWAASVKLLGNPKLLEEMLKFDRENSDDKLIMNLGKFLNDPEK